MKARIALADPENVEVMMAVTMPLKTWKHLRSRLRDPDDWHSSGEDMAAAIDRLVEQAEAHFEGAVTTPASDEA